MINLKGTYKLPNWDIEFTDPIITERTASDNINKKVCDVSIMIEVDGAKSTYGYNLGKYTYTDTWEDADIDKFIKKEMEKYKL